MAWIFVNSHHWDADLYCSMLSAGTYRDMDLFTLWKTSSPNTGGTIALHVMDVNPSHPAKAASLIDATEAGITIDVSLL